MPIAWVAAEARAARFIHREPGTRGRLAPTLAIGRTDMRIAAIGRPMRPLWYFINVTLDGWVARASAAPRVPIRSLFCESVRGMKSLLRRCLCDRSSRRRRSGRGSGCRSHLAPSPQGRPGSQFMRRQLASIWAFNGLSETARTQRDCQPNSGAVGPRPCDRTSCRVPSGGAGRSMRQAPT